MEASPDKESCLVMLTRHIFQLERENSLLRAKLIDYQIRQGSRDRLKLLLQRRSEALAEEKARYEEEKKNAQSNRSVVVRCNCGGCHGEELARDRVKPDVTCDCGECDEGYDEVDEK